LVAQGAVFCEVLPQPVKRGWKFTPKGKPKMVKTIDNGPYIQLAFGTDPNNPETIQHQISTTKGQCTLGVHLTPDGNNYEEFSYQLQQAMKMNQWIKMAPLGREYIGISLVLI
jgi:hypothetical protein